MQAVANYMVNEAQRQPRTLIVGLGATGLSCARFLAARGVEVAVTDSRERPPALETMGAELPDVALFLGGYAADIFARAERLVVSPGVSLREPLIAAAAQRGVEILGDIELFARHARAPVIAITGSNGKSTVTTLVGEMARQAGMQVRVGGNLGTPALDLLSAEEPDLYVLELSSFQLETVTSLRCKVSAVLNISPDHLDRYAGLDEYMAAKRRIYAGAAIQVVNRDDPRAAALAGLDAAQLSFGLDAPGENDFGVLAGEGGAWIVRGSERWLPVSHLRIAGRHNLANAVAALALGSAAGIERQAMLRVLREFQGLAHRTQWVAEIAGVSWYNDSKATNVGATLAAVRGFDAPLVLIAGGQPKGADFTELAAGTAGRLRGLVLIGEATEQIARAFAAAALPVQRAGSMREAVSAAAQLARSGDLVLLSPACASFDMFDNYQHRGDVFIQTVRELAR